MSSLPGSVSVVVCAYTEDRWSDLTAAITSLDEQILAPDEIVVVVDHNRSLYERAARTLQPGVIVVENTGTRGLSGARNTGIATSLGEVVAFLDDDAVAAPGWLAHLLAPYADEYVVAVGGKVEPRWADERPAWFPPEFDWVVGCTYTGHRADAGPVRNLIGANMSFRRATLDALRGFRDGIGRVGTVPTGCEETELCIRARQHDPMAIVWYTPDAVVEHHVPVARASWRYFRARCGAEGASKALVTEGVGRRDGLASERAYVLRTLPAAIGRDLVRGAWRRAGARAAGVTATAFGYARARRAHTAIPPFEPILVAEIDLDQPLPALSDVDAASGRRYDRARVLVRAGVRPVGVVDLELPPGGLSAGDLGDRVGASRLAVSDSEPGPSDPRDLPRATVVVATRDRPAALVACLGSLLAMDYPDYEILVVDNAPATDDARSVVEQMMRPAGPPVRYLREDRPGLAAAHNRALPDATGAFIAFTDDDVLVDRHWLKMLALGFRAADDVGCVTGLIAPLELETEVQAWIEDGTGFAKGTSMRVFGLDDPPADPLFPYTAGAFGSGANMAFRADVLRDMGGFDAALGAGTPARGGDDLAAFAEVVLRGHRLVYQPAAIVHHRHRRDHDGLRRQVFGYGAGLTAYLTSVVVADHARLRAIAALAPRGAVYALNPRSAKNARVPSTMPKALTYRERLGMLAGPFLYSASRRSNRREPAGRP